MKNITPCQGTRLRVRSRYNSFMTDKQVSDNITSPMQTQLTTKQDEFNILMLLSQTQTRAP